MHIYPVAESVCRRILELPVNSEEWVVTGADHAGMVATGFVPFDSDPTRFRHERSGDTYQLARHQHFDAETGALRYQCDPQVSLESELATRPITLLAMASDAGNIIDPFEGQDDLVDGLLKHVTPNFVHVPANLLVTAVWASRLAHWGFRVAHGTHGLMKKMVADRAVAALPRAAIADAALHAFDAPRPSGFFRVLQRCGALRELAPELDALYGDAGSHGGSEAPAVMRLLDDARKDSDNMSHTIKAFHDGLGDQADAVFRSLGLASLYRRARD